MSEKVTTIEWILKRRWLSHTIFWFSLLTISSLYKTAVYAGGSLHYFTIDNLALLFPQMACAYYLTYFLIPKFFSQKRYFAFAAAFGATLYVSALLGRIFVVYFAEPIIRASAEPEPFLDIIFDPGYLMIQYVPAVMFYPVLLAGIKTVLDKYREQERYEQLEKEKVKTELAFLKSQVHPHFLLNTLNNLYALTLKKSDKAPETVIRLSELLSYTLYKTDARFVALEHEIKLLENYVALEELRYDDTLDLELNARNADPGFNVAPLILLPLVENAFKHGVSEKIEDARIKIDLETDDNKLKFRVFNTREEIQSEDKQNYRKGIGLSNLRKQLDLVYPESHKLTINESKETFEAILEVEQVDVEG